MDKLTAKEQQKYIVIKEYVDGKISRKQAAIKLQLTLPTISVLKTNYVKYGKKVFSHRNKGNLNATSINNAIEEEIVRLYRTEFNGFNFTHFYDVLVEEQWLRIESLPSRKTVFNILERHNITSPAANRQKRKPNQHPVRPRRESFGELVQMDASQHDWLCLGPEHKFHLHLCIDDATSRLLAGHFERQETLHGYYVISKQLFSIYGLPRTFYTDRRTVFESMSSIRKDQVRTQFNNVCSALGIEVITTSTAQAKGRVERCFRTLQDRLVNEMKVNGIKTIEDANRFLRGYIERHNKKFALDNSSISNSFSKLDKNTKANLDRILCVTTSRSILNGNVISFNNEQFMPLQNNGNILALATSTKIEIIQTLDGRLLAKYQNEYYKLTKTANGRFTGHTPSPEHPWKRHNPEWLGS
jgi:hypothetical protein